MNYDKHMKTKKFLIIFMLLLGCSFGAYAQNVVEVTGLVTDSNKEPLIGVNVSIKDMPGLGAITDINGKYRIKVEQFQRLIFSYVGFDKKEVLIKEQRVVNIMLKESEASSLDEVVITGTGAQKKLTVTGAVTNVNVEDLQRAPGGKLTNALAGNVAGVLARQTSGQPGKNTSEFWIRGISTFGANSSALVLVDGFERDIDDVNIEDIESFSVLKDASATAIYGNRGANGVVLIKTKRGKAGKINIDVKVESTYNGRTITPDFVDGYTYANMVNEARLTRNQEAIYQPDELEMFRSGLDPDLYPNVNWKDLLLKNGAMTYRANVNMNGGGTTARYFVSLSYTDEDGMYKTDDAMNDYDTNARAKTWNYRMNTDIDITKTTLLKVGVSGALRKFNESSYNGEIWNAIVYQNPISIPVMYSNGYIPAMGTGGRTNPWVMSTQTGYVENWTNHANTNLELSQNFDFVTKGLSFVGRFGFDVANNNWIKRIKWPEQYRAQRFRDVNGELVFSKISDEGKMVQQSGSHGWRKEFFEAELHYDRAFKGHHLNNTLKYSQDTFNDTQNQGSDIKNSIARRHMGWAGRVAYNWNYRYFIDFNFGYNGSENFADGHQFGFFPAFSTAWNIAEEPIIKNNLKWMNMFKVRYSFGKVGSDNLGDNRFPYLYSVGGGNGYQWGDYGYNRSYNGMRLESLASKNVTWEIATKHDIGIDVSLFHDKLTATVDYFHEQRDGIYMTRNFLPFYVGVESNPSANVGSVLSKGFDGNFAFKQKVGQVDVTVRGNFTYSKNKILERDEENTTLKYLLQEGHRIDQARGLIAEGLFKDYDDIRNSPKQVWGSVQPGDIKYKDVNGDGVVDGADMVAIGATTRPNLIYGLGVAAYWKGLDVNLHLQGAGKSSFFIEGSSVHIFSAGDWGNIFKDIAESNRWIEGVNEDPNADFPRLCYGHIGTPNENNYQRSTYWLRDGRYLRLKTLELGYTLPKSLVNKIHFNNIRIFFIGTNLLTFSPFKMWDPEMGIGHGGQYPLPKSYTVGLVVNL